MPDELNDFLSSLGVPPTQSESEETPAQEESTPPAESEAQPPAPPENQEKESEQTPPVQPDRNNAAFAAMRVELSKYKKVLKNAAQLAGLDPNVDLEVLEESFQKNLINKQAEETKIPPEFIARMTKNEEQLTVLQQKEYANNALVGFAKVKQDYKLTNNQLADFAQGLKLSGVDPFKQPVDIVREYRLRNFDSLLEAAKRQGELEATERLAKAEKSSSTPGDKAGGDPGAASKINSLSEFEAFLNKSST